MFVCLFIHSFICLWMSNCFSIICWKGYLSFVALLLHPHQNHICVDLFLDSLFSYSDVWIYPLPLTVFMTVLIYKSWNQVVWFFLLFFFFRIVLAVLVRLPFHINFKIILFMSSKNLAIIWIEIALILYTNLRRIDIFTMLHLPIHEHGMSLRLFGLYLISFIKVL